MRALVLFLVSLTLLLSGCTQTFFQPNRMLVNTPDVFGLSYEPMEMRAADGTAIFGWFMPAQGLAYGTVLFLHGNAENISTHIAAVAWMPRAGFNVLALDYRGYGRSGGSPSLPGALLDIDAAMRALMARRDVDPNRLVLFGQSLGGALAIYYAAHTTYRANIRAVVADSSFSDYREISREKFANLFITWPLQWLPWLTVNDSYSPDAAIGEITPLPLLLVHGDSDTLVPLHHAQRLYELAAQPKELWVIPGAGHIQAVRDSTFRKRLATYLERQLDAPRGQVAATQ